MEKMVRAAVSVAAGKVEMQEFPWPKLEPGAAIVKVELCGVCGTDKHSYRGETKQGVGTGNEVDMPFPIIQGHEIVATIAEITEEGSKCLDFDGNILRPGDRVTICPDVTCGHCYYCKNNPDYPWCEKLDFTYGCSKGSTTAPHLFGGFAEYMYIDPKSRLYKVPEGLSNRRASFTEVMTVTYALDKAKEFYSFAGEGFGFGDTVVVQGVGPLGLAHVIKARMLGAGEIIVTDISDWKLDLAKKFGADVALNTNKTTREERVDLVLQKTKGLGASVVVECVGKPFVIPEGFDMLRKAGTYLETGMFVDMGNAEWNPHVVCSKSLRILGMYNHMHSKYQTTMQMMVRQGDRFPWDEYVSHVFPLEQTQQAVETSMKEESMKVLVQP
ncbi:MAG: zinc-binding dehydrogenase [Christensenellales bacterium]|jgi:threonine dehydrogenase-like Zn-dependent dehydrogenase